MIPTLGFAQPVSSWLHLFGAAAFAVMGWQLLRRAKDFPDRWPFLGVFAACCVLLLSISGVFHSLPRGSARTAMLSIDHSSIFVLIAATFTGVHGTLFHGWRRWGPLFVVWAAAVTGIVCRMLAFKALPDWGWAAIYVVPTWSLACFSMWLVARRHGTALLMLPLWAGAAYSVGVAFNYSGLVIIPGVVGSHEIWHVCVLAGMSCFWKFLYELANVPREETDRLAASKAQSIGSLTAESG